MKKNISLSELKLLRDSLLAELCPVLEESDARHENVQQILTGCPVISAPVETAVEALISSSEKLYANLLREEATLYKKVLETRQEQNASSRFGLYQAALPVLAGDRICCCLRTGWMITEPVSGKLLSELEAHGTLSDKELKRAVESLRVYTREEEQQVTAFLRQLRDLLSVLLDESRRADSLAEQLISSERARSLGALTGGVAHHFNSLLSVILGYSSFMLNRLSLPPEASDALEHISEAAQKGRRLTEEMLAFLGSEAEVQATCGVHEILEGVVSLLNSQVHSRVRFTMNLGAKNDEISARPSALHQVIFNLVTNSLAAMDGPGCIMVVTQNTEMRTGNVLRRFIEIGVAEQEGEKSAEEMPLTGDSSAPENASLKISSLFGLVADLEGSVLIDPAAVSGKPRVKVILPTIAQADARAASPDGGDQLKPSTIWVVDDDETFRKMCEFVLSGQGHTVLSLSGANELQDKWTGGATPPDMIIMDFSMPDFNGLEMCQWLRRAGADVPVVLVSGLSANQPDIHRATAMKRTTFLQKPFTFRELTDAVEKALAESLIGGR